MQTTPAAARPGLRATPPGVAGQVWQCAPAPSLANLWTRLQGAMARREATQMLGAVPLSWVEAAKGPRPYINVGDALSPVLVALVSGRPVRSLPFRSKQQRMGAIGTVGQSFQGGVVDIWGTGCSPHANPLDPGPKIAYAPPPGTRLILHATRGPLSAALLSGGDRPAIPYGDPAWLLPRFYRPEIEKRWELGVILHLSELADRGWQAVPKPGLTRYEIPADLAGAVRLITMVAPVSTDAIRGKIDELLACRRIVSTSLHGVALAECYGIPCLYLGSDTGVIGPARATLGEPSADAVNQRFPDLYGGLGLQSFVYWRQRRRVATPWERLIQTIDRVWHPKRLDEDALIAACPAGADPVPPPPRGTIWDLPLIRDLRL